MSNDQLRQEFQRVTQTLQYFENYSKDIQYQIETLNNYLLDIQRSKATLSNIKIEKKLGESLINLGSGVMLKVKPLESNKVYYNVGAGVILTRKVDEAITDLDNRIEEIQTKSAGLTDQLQQVYQQMQQLEQQGQAMATQLQGAGGKDAQYDPNLIS
ncbi:MAG: prefoldin subunit alpha [Candidatus Heimdallarchaeota archaeon]